MPSCHLLMPNEALQGSSVTVKRFNNARGVCFTRDDSRVEFIATMTSNLDEYECVGECRDRLRAADFTTRFASSFVAS